MAGAALHCFSSVHRYLNQTEILLHQLQLADTKYLLQFDGTYRTPVSEPVGQQILVRLTSAASYQTAQIICTRPGFKVLLYRTDEMLRRSYEPRALRNDRRQRGRFGANLQGFDMPEAAGNIFVPIVHIVELEVVPRLRFDDRSSAC